MVEFALSAGLLVIIMLGIFDLGRIYNTAMVLTNAAREGAYYGTMHPYDTAGIAARAVQEAQGSGVNIGSGNVSVSSSGVPGTEMRVTVQFDFNLFSFVPGIPNVHLQRSAVMVVY